MAQNTSPIFVLTPQTEIYALSATNTSRDGTGTIVTGITGASTTTRVEVIQIQATATTTAGFIRIFLKKSGGSYLLIREVAVTAATPSVSVAAFYTEIVRGDGLPLLTLESGDILGFSTHNAETFNVVVIAGDY